MSKFCFEAIRIAISGVISAELQRPWRRLRCAPARLYPHPPPPPRPPPPPPPPPPPHPPAEPPSPPSPPPPRPATASVARPPPSPSARGGVAKVPRADPSGGSRDLSPACTQAIDRARDCAQLWKVQPGADRCPQRSHSHSGGLHFAHVLDGAWRGAREEARRRRRERRRGCALVRGRAATRAWRQRQQWHERVGWAAAPATERNPGSARVYSRVIKSHQPVRPR